LNFGLSTDFYCSALALAQQKGSVKVLVEKWSRPLCALVCTCDCELPSDYRFDGFV